MSSMCESKYCDSENCTCGTGPAAAGGVLATKAMGSGKLYSPSKYEAVIGKTAETRVFGRIMEARNASYNQTDSAMAKFMAKDAAAKERARLEEEAKGEEIAAKLQQEEDDLVVAYEMAEKEKAAILEAQRMEAKRVEEDARVVQQLFAEEEAARAQAELALAKDQAMAAQLQRAEVAEIETIVAKIARAWQSPDIQCKNAGINLEICFKLPLVGELTAEAAEDNRTVVVKAFPDFGELLQRQKLLPEELQLTSLDITMDLKIVGKSHVSKEDITVKLDKETEMCYVFVANANIRASQSSSSLVSRVSSTLKKALSWRRGSDAASAK